MSHFMLDLQEVSAISAPHPGDVPPNPTWIDHQNGPDKSHPLVHIRLIVDRACVRKHSGCLTGTGLSTIDRRIVRAAVLQSLYSFGHNELLMEHLRYNTLYRWFVGLNDGESPWSAASYAEALSGVRDRLDGANALSISLLQASSYAALLPDRFCIDRYLIESWTSMSRDAAKYVAAEIPATSDRCCARLERAREIIVRRICDPDLTPESIAAEMCMSRRALFLLFSAQGLTPARVIRDLRLDRCRDLLSDARHRNRKITDIAMDVGFSHPETFSRKFKDRFGQSPVEVRSAAGASPSRDYASRYSRYAQAVG